MQDVPDEPELEDRIRDAPDIARRALALFAVVALALGAPKDEALAWLQSDSIRDELSPQELAFVSASPPSEKQTINASWRSEALLMLLWSLAIVEELPGLNEQCNASDFQVFLPPYADISVSQFISSAQQRTDSALIAMADSLLNAHWAARDVRFSGRAMPPHLDIGIIQERHHAINWVIGYCGLPWDEVTTDT